MNKEYVLQIVGFYREEFIKSMTVNPGVYFVFIGTKTDRGCIIRRCIYIGKAEEQGVRARLSSHEKMPLFKSEQEKVVGTILYFAFAECPIADVAEIENALIKGLQPDINVLAKESFESKFDSVTIQLQGSVPVIFAEKQVFTIQPDRGA